MSGKDIFPGIRGLQELIIGISEDVSLGWSLVQGKAAGEQEQPDVTSAALEFMSAWITHFERRQDKWIRQDESASFYQRKQMQS